VWLTIKGLEIAMSFVTVAGSGAGPEEILRFNREMISLLGEGRGKTAKGVGKPGPRAGG